MCVQSWLTLYDPIDCVHGTQPMSMGFPRQEYRSELPLPSLGHLPDPGIKPVSVASPELAGGLFIKSTTWEVIA